LPSAKKSFLREFLPAFQLRLSFLFHGLGNCCQFSLPLASARHGRFASGSAAVLNQRFNILFSPNLGQTAIENMFDVIGFEDVKGDRLGAPPQLDRSRTCALQAAIIHPLMSLARGDRKDVLCFAWEHSKSVMV